MFPKPTRDHLSLRGSAFMEKHGGLESFGIVRAFSGFQEMEIVWDSRRTHIMLEKAKLENMPPKGREQCDALTTLLFWNQKTLILPSGHSIFHWQIPFSGSVNQMVQKPAFPQPKSVGLSGFHVTGIDSEDPNGSLLNRWFSLNTLPQYGWHVPEFCSLLSFPFSSL